MSQQEDYYKIMGVSKTASPEEIKKAYRKLAMQHHPDRNSDNPKAEAEFKKIGEAYSVLSDPAKRQQYDNLGHSNFTNMHQNGGGQHSAHDFSDIFGAFSDFFDTGSRKSRASGSDLLYRLDITFEESLLGVKKQIKYSTQDNCSGCRGSGAEAGTEPKTCQSCRGSGYVGISQGFISFQQPCPACHGQGKIITVACKQCRGKGLVNKEQVVDIDIPKGINDGDRLVVRGKGEASAHGRNGDLYVDIKVKSHNIFKRQGLDLFAEIPISIVTATLGGEVKVVGPSANIYSLTIPAETQSHTVFKMTHKGVHDAKGKKGDLLIKVIVETPVKLSQEQKELLKKFDSISSDSNKPKQNAFWRHIESFINRIKF